uniref:Uncharacterized protein n=1 Tax=Ananas comosus var. bracteatus TaxID=296719 RepID=A0A6V7NYT2_ANACO|nr:unnamed protein product [Ananas comosus var. bracteatus]
MAQERRNPAGEGWRWVIEALGAAVVAARPGADDMRAEERRREERTRRVAIGGEVRRSRIWEQQTAAEEPKGAFEQPGCFGRPERGSGRPKVAVPADSSHAQLLKSFAKPSSSTAAVADLDRGKGVAS